MRQKVGEMFRGRLWPLSNMYPCSVRVAWGSFGSAEAAFQAAKDPSVAKQFETIDGFAAKKLGRRVSLRPDWEAVKVDIMRQVVEAKFSNPELNTVLTNTTGPLVEYNTHYDDFWGQVLKNGRWVGHNHLGRLLVEQRDKNTREETIMASLSEIRRYIPYATDKDVARLGVAPQDYAAFGYEYFLNRWCAQHVILAANMEAVKNATNIFEVQTRWYDADNRYMGEGAALIPTYSVKAAKDIFAAYVKQQFGADHIMEFPDKRAPMLMYGEVAAFYQKPDDWWQKALKRGDIRCLNGEGRRPDPKPSVKETTLADGRRIVEDEVIESENAKEKIAMKNEEISINSNVIMDDDLDLTDDFCVVDEAHRTYVPEAVSAEEPVEAEPQCTGEDTHNENVDNLNDEYANVVIAATVDEYAVTDAAFEVAVDAEVKVAVANNDTPPAAPSGDNTCTTITVLKPAGTATIEVKATAANHHDDTPPVDHKPAKARKMPGIIAGLNVAAAITAGITMAEAAQRMGEIRTLRAQLKALGKPGVEVKVPTRPQRVRGHKLADAVVEFELFEDFYKVLVAEFEAKYGAATTTAVDNPLPADKPEAATVQEQEEISPDVSDTVTVEEKPLPVKPEDPEDDPEDPQDPEEPSDGDNGDDEPANDNPPADTPVFDDGDNNSDGTGAPSDIAAASADQEVNDGPDFCDEESVPPTPEELYGDAIRKVLRKYGNDTSSLGTVQLFLHEERRLVVNFDTDESVEVDDESLDWVSEQIARQQVTNDSGYSPYGHDDLDDIDETSLTPQQPQEPAQPDPEPQQQPVEDSQLMAEYKAMIERYLKLPNYVIDGGGILSDAEVAKLVAAKKQQDADTLTLGGQMLLAFFGDDTVRAAAELDAAINGYNPKKVKMTKLQEMQFSKRTTLKVIEGVRQDKAGNFYVKGSRGRLIHDWVKATVVDGIGFVFENPPKDKHFFR